MLSTIEAQMLATIREMSTARPFCARDPLCVGFPFSGQHRREIRVMILSKLTASVEPSRLITFIRILVLENIRENFGFNSSRSLN
ncbi:hypothetical protein FR483_n771R [Paramecium bursaria Chlorella virus FR483]|uniref:Uncharacterized protein n771R n=1 Tax=Paramecium bursaria Chlorella virus FR483 TaxID=399781 RepID=A7J8C5_PBCVF|nr:hypothetical protein FR483_n771R [Paramecium bursaria Chlorella virus FR483]ABT16056.1 hypothetical protein FR483_n771R [Paramecium bursaria Chlorella virus FR483]